MNKMPDCHRYIYLFHLFDKKFWEKLTFFYMASTANFTISLKFFKKSFFSIRKHTFAEKDVCRKFYRLVRIRQQICHLYLILKKRPIHFKGQTSAGQYKMNQLTLEVGIAKREVLVLLPKGVLGMMFIIFINNLSKVIPARSDFCSVLNHLIGIYWEGFVDFSTIHLVTPDNQLNTWNNTVVYDGDCCILHSIIWSWSHNIQLSGCVKHLLFWLKQEVPVYR